jgi:hypothetical protein
LLLSFGNEDVTKALGLLWNSTIDKLIFYVQINQDNTPTNRSVLRANASIYDPLSYNVRYSCNNNGKYE